LSILLQALRRKEAEASGRPATPPATEMPAEERRWAPFLPALLAAAGVFAAAFLTFLLTRPGSITVIVPPTNSSATTPAVSAPPFTPLPPPDLLAFEPLREDYRIVPPPMAGAPLPSGVLAPRPTSSNFADRLPAVLEGTPSPAAPDFRSIPVYAGARLQPPDADLPPDAVTIEMSEATIESLNGGVMINGASAQPGSRIQVGSELRTAAGGAASIGFTRASVELGAASAGKITRLERRSTAAGQPAEDVTLHLASGDVRAVVRPGGGSVLVSTDPLTAATASGAFHLTREANGGIRVKNEGGSVRLIPTARPDDAIQLGAGEEIVYRDGAWIRR
jgi:hypothetical protein